MISRPLEIAAIRGHALLRRLLEKAGAYVRPRIYTSQPGTRSLDSCGHQKARKKVFPSFRRRPFFVSEAVLPAKLPVYGCWPGTRLRHVVFGWIGRRWKQRSPLKSALHSGICSQYELFFRGRVLGPRPCKGRGLWKPYATLGYCPFRAAAHQLPNSAFS